MAKKKFKFTDLSDDIDVFNDNNNHILSNTNPVDSFNININELNNKPENPHNTHQEIATKEQLSNSNNEINTNISDFNNIKIDHIQQIKTLETTEHPIKDTNCFENNTIIKSNEPILSSNNLEQNITKINDELQITTVNEKVDSNIIQSTTNNVDDNNFNVKENVVLNQNNGNNIYDNKINTIDTTSIHNNFEYKSKYDIDVDYDSNIPISEQIKQHKIIQNDKKINNELTNKKQHMTFNETVKSLEENNKPFDDNKIQHFFTSKEKLDVKTNIYLKPNLVSKIQALSKQTGESRSAIINKLIEHALKVIG